MNAVTVAERADSPAVPESTPRSKKKSLVRLAIGAAVIAGVGWYGQLVDGRSLRRRAPTMPMSAATSP